MFRFSLAALLIPVAVNPLAAPAAADHCLAVSVVQVAAPPVLVAAAANHVRVVNHAALATPVCNFEVQHSIPLAPLRTYAAAGVTLLETTPVVLAQPVVVSHQAFVTNACGTPHAGAVVRPQVVRPQVIRSRTVTTIRPERNGLLRGIFGR